MECVFMCPLRLYQCNVVTFGGTLFAVIVCCKYISIISDCISLHNKDETICYFVPI